MRILTTLPLLLLLAVLHAPAPAQAQDAAFTPSLFVEVNGGAAGYGAFLEERVASGQRELTATSGATFGGAVGYQVGRKISVRVAGAYSTGELAFVDDSGTGSDALDDEGLADLSTISFSLEAVRYVFNGDRRVVPYAVAGFAGGLYRLGDAPRGGIGNGGEDTRLRLGGVGGLGLLLRATPLLSVRLEANTLSLGNPFDGKDAFTSSGERFDEPKRTSLRRLTLSLGYSF